MGITLKDEKSFNDEFLSEYMSKGFASISKRELDVLMMHLLMKYSNLNLKSNFQLSLDFKLSESKIKNLKYESKLKYMDDNEYIQRTFFSLFKKINLKKANGNIWISFAVEDNYLKQAIQAMVKENGSFTDSSFNSEIVKLNADDLAFIIDTLFDEKEKNKSIKELQQVVKKSEEIKFQPLFKSFLESVVDGAGSEVGKQSVSLPIGALTGGLPQLANLVGAFKSLIRGIK